jgi:hypothetical protein
MTARKPSRMAQRVQEGRLTIVGLAEPNDGRQARIGKLNNSL